MTNEELEFLEWDKKQTKNKAKPYKRIIQRAVEAYGGTNDFIMSCSEFLRTRGFLTEKQIAALEDQGEHWSESEDQYWDAMYDQIHFRD